MFGTWSNSSSALPPDVVLEVGPQPCCTRYVAHGSLLALHSGYLRAALRTVDPVQSNEAFGSLCRVSLHHPHIPTIISAASLPPFAIDTARTEPTVLYLPNVTTEQFTPLLSYMYTGYLDLTVDNIFGVLLATHLLHMPRALELCRTFLSSSSSTLTAVVHAGGLAPPSSGVQLLERNYYGAKTTTVTVPAHMNAPRLVRPIASKALATVGLHFIAPPTASQISLLPTAPFRSLGSSISSNPKHSEHGPLEVTEEINQVPSHQSAISVTQHDDDRFSLRDIQSYSVDNNDSTDNITVDGEYDKNESDPIPNDEIGKDNSEKTTKGKNYTNLFRTHRSVPTQIQVKRHKSIELATDGGSRRNDVIIDIASCDGPVRFRRVLNVMYGCNNDNRSPHATTLDDARLSNATADGTKDTLHSRSSSHASSFHQQMARNISYTGKLTEESLLSSSYSITPDLFQKEPSPGQQSILQDLQREYNQQKDENSQEDNTSHNNEESARGHTGSSSYTCMYCKHSFKSHYCYQKHAKRHLIPLPLDHGSDSPLLAVRTTYHQTKINHTNTSSSNMFSDGRRRSNSASTNSNNSADSFKRQVKPLNMNVQYYPCKTCGSKFPSYYFVHKHRKLCHADEDDGIVGHGNTSQNDSIHATITISKIMSQQSSTSDNIDDVMFDDDILSDKQKDRAQT